MIVDDSPTRAIRRRIPRLVESTSQRTGSRVRQWRTRSRLKAVVAEADGPLPNGSVTNWLPEPESAIKVLDRHVEAARAGSEDLAGRHAIMTSVPNMGPATGASLIALTGEP